MSGVVRFLLPVLAWMSVWIAGCLVFDYWLALAGSWLMLGGAVTFMAAEAVQAFAKIALGVANARGAKS